MLSYFRLKRLSPNTRIILGRLVPFAAVASAGALNVFLIRREEIRRGIEYLSDTNIRESCKERRLAKRS
jgi:sideroflexin-5